MNQYRDLWKELCSYENLELAFRKARKHKTTRDYVIAFEGDLTNNLLLLRSELLLHCYQPKPLVNFVIRDPKTRKISKSAFRDRIVHHALCNVIEPLFEKSFIYDSYANRKTKGTLKAIERFEHFKRKASKNHKKSCYVLKGDIEKYFENVDHLILKKIIKGKINDKRILWLINIILSNGAAKTEKQKGMPLGNLTSQFFANVYLNMFDHFVKHKLKIKCYIRYVDDFVILHKSKELLLQYKEMVSSFLKEKLNLTLHQDKSKVFPTCQGTEFLGLKIFLHHKLIKKKNRRKFMTKFAFLCSQYDFKKVDYDNIYDFLEGWIAYAKHANTYKLRQKILSFVEERFSTEISTKEVNRLLKDHKKFSQSQPFLSQPL